MEREKKHAKIKETKKKKEKSTFPKSEAGKNVARPWVGLNHQPFG